MALPDKKAFLRASVERQTAWASDPTLSEEDAAVLLEWAGEAREVSAARVWQAVLGNPNVSLAFALQQLDAYDFHEEMPPWKGSQRWSLAEAVAANPARPLEMLTAPPSLTDDTFVYFVDYLGEVPLSETLRATRNASAAVQRARDALLTQPSRLSPDALENMRYALGDARIKPKGKPNGLSAHLLIEAIEEAVTHLAEDVSARTATRNEEAVATASSRFVLRYLVLAEASGQSPYPYLFAMLVPFSWLTPPPEVVKRLSPPEPA